MHFMPKKTPYLVLITHLPSGSAPFVLACLLDTEYVCPCLCLVGEANLADCGTKYYGIDSIIR